MPRSGGSPTCQSSRTESTPAPPTRLSLPPQPTSVSSPAPPISVSLLLPPLRLTEWPESAALASILYDALLPQPLR
ncbi:MAG: hypothetical protein EBY28_14485 [Betaproteobacteria bacterium]|nr:hypothetical protein [Betaproteobacteria bacterium]